MCMCVRVRSSFGWGGVCVRASKDQRLFVEYCYMCACGSECGPLLTQRERTGVVRWIPQRQWCVCKNGRNFHLKIEDTVHHQDTSWCPALSRDIFVLRDRDNDRQTQGMISSLIKIFCTFCRKVCVNVSFPSERIHGQPWQLSLSSLKAGLT